MTEIVLASGMIESTSHYTQHTYFTSPSLRGRAYSPLLFERTIKSHCAVASSFFLTQQLFCRSQCAVAPSDIVLHVRKLKTDNIKVVIAKLSKRPLRSHASCDTCIKMPMPPLDGPSLRH